ncbi:MAG: hypothetical protein IPK99_16265 [Flavobacteriales bacterium]|nr:hypothetical protein [Flavobacteriales bacterium]
MKTAFVIAVLSMVLRVALFSTDHAPEPPFYMPAHLLALVLIPFLVGRSELLASSEASITHLFREGLRASALYVLLTGFFLYAFYTWMDVTSFPVHVNALVDQAVLAGKDEADARARFSEFFSPFNYASLSFFLMLLLAAFNTLLVTVLLHKVVRPLARERQAI